MRNNSNYAQKYASLQIKLLEEQHWMARKMSRLSAFLFGVVLGVLVGAVLMWYVVDILRFLW